MAKLSIVGGTTGDSELIFIQDSSSTTGAGRSGLAFNTTGLSATYAFSRQLPVTITFATLTATTAAFSSGGFIELNSSIMTGWYRFDIPNAALAAGNGRRVALHFFGAASMAPLPVEIELTGWDNQLAFANQTIAAITAPVTIVQSPVTVVAISAGILGNQTIAAVAAPVTVGAMSANISGNQTVAAVVGTVAASVTAMSANISGNQTIASVVGTVAASVTAMSANISGNQTVAAVAAPVSIGAIGPVTVVAMSANIMGSQTIAAVAASIGVSIGPVTVAAMVANIMGSQTIAQVAGSIGSVGSVIPVNVVQMNSVTVIGAGTAGNLWRA